MRSRISLLPPLFGKREGKVFHRVLRLGRLVWQIKADLRHGKLAADQLGIALGTRLSALGHDVDNDDVEPEKLCSRWVQTRQCFWDSRLAVTLWL